MVGRTTTPNEIKKLKGTNQPCRIKNEISVDKINDINVIEAKKNLLLKSRRAKLIFKEKASQLIALNMLTELDIESVALYAYNLDQLFDCVAQLEKEGKYFKRIDELGNEKYIENPNVKLYNKYFENVMKLGAEFGFSPASRLKFKGQGSPEKNDPFDIL